MYGYTCVVHVWICMYGYTHVWLHIYSYVSIQAFTLCFCAAVVLHGHLCTWTSEARQCGKCLYDVPTPTECAIHVAGTPKTSLCNESLHEALLICQSHTAHCNKWSKRGGSKPWDKSETHTRWTNCQNKVTKPWENICKKTNKSRSIQVTHHDHRHCCYMHFRSLPQLPKAACA